MNILKDLDCGYCFLVFFCKLEYLKVVEDMHVEIVV